ncbi:hypothetical protein ZIOFF_013859 [Zingiber officinale]|uniref:BED-type domain-containing protein n=1 Tax=Zingiber officinale TaxID=94328 RepID=A0A8J5HCS8_ZINOF|nr:hypothetical protein ZIOFF_013859 [Zingiber officinale]
MESEEASINLQDNNNVLEITPENDGGGNDLRVDGISKCSGKRKYTSEAWNHFERVMVENIQFAECNYCKARLKAPASHGTTHLLKHYEKTCKKRPRKMDIRQSLMASKKMWKSGLDYPYFQPRGFKIYGERSQFKVDEIRQNCYDLLLDYQSRTETRENSLSARSSVAMGNISSSCASGRVSATLHKYDQFVASSDPITLVSKTSELDTYLGESVLPRARNFDILSWWKTNGVKYPNLLKMARDILVIPVSTVASESAFSDSGRLVSPHRSTSNVSDLSNCPTMLDEEEEDDHDEHIADHSDIAQ